MTMIRALSRIIYLMYQYWLNVRVKGATLIGADTLIDWDTDRRLIRYMSFSIDPYTIEGISDEAAYFDAFGVEDSDIFYYLDGFWELIRFILTESHDGWRITHAWLVYIDN
jgi:hypothetical protein